MMCVYTDELYIYIIYIYLCTHSLSFSLSLPSPLLEKILVKGLNLTVHTMRIK